MMVECRLEGFAGSARDLADILRRLPPTIATCHVPVAGQDAARTLAWALEAGAGAVDLDLAVAPEAVRELLPLARRQGVRVIRSAHRHLETPALDELRELVEHCFTAGADVAKVATMARTPEDGPRVLRLYDKETRPLLAFCMGEAGRTSRLESVRRGAPWVYCRWPTMAPTAPGQPTVEEAARALRERE